jgi:hypothetical protein
MKDTEIKKENESWLERKMCDPEFREAFEEEQVKWEKALLEDCVRLETRVEAAERERDEARAAYKNAIERADAAEAKLAAFTEVTRRRGPLRILLGTAYLQAVNNNQELATTVLDLIEHIDRLIGPVPEAFEDGGKHG